MLKKNFEPTDFADADCRVTQWMPFEGFTAATRYRIWLCKCGNGYWFQRHEWSEPGRNQTTIDGWIFSGYSSRRNWDAHYEPAPDLTDI